MSKYGDNGLIDGLNPDHMPVDHPFDPEQRAEVAVAALQSLHFIRDRGAL